MGDHFLTNRHFHDINPILYGREECKRGQSCGPAIRKYTLIHFVESGSGIFMKNGTTYEVRAGQAFIILPGELTYYASCESDPWIYRWIGFDGEQSEKYRELPPVISMSIELFPHIPDGREDMGCREHLLAGQIFLMSAALFGGVDHHNHHVRRVKDYINSSYMCEVSVEQIARDLSLDRRYLSRLFKEKTGKSVKEYLIFVRMEEACRLLDSGRSVAESAALCGYADVCNFSKMFKRVYGISPSARRRVRP